MTLSRQQIDTLLEMLSSTQEEELTCDECAQLLADFAENYPECDSLTTGLEAVKQHLQLCGECREEFEALLRSLENNK